MSIFSLKDIFFSNKSNINKVSNNNEHSNRINRINKFENSNKLNKYNSNTNNTVETLDLSSCEGDSSSSNVNNNTVYDRLISQSDKEFTYKQYDDYQPKSENEKVEIAENIFKNIIGFKQIKGRERRAIRESEPTNDIGNDVLSLEDLGKTKTINCNETVSIYLQEIGCLEPGTKTGHTVKAEGKETIKDSVIGLKNLKNCKVVFTDCKYNELPEDLKKAGVVYIQNSNTCVSAGDGYVWTANAGHRAYHNDQYNVYEGGIHTNEGYSFKSNIKAVIVPY